MKKKKFSNYIFKLNLANEIITLAICLIVIFLIVSDYYIRHFYNTAMTNSLQMTEYLDRILDPFIEQGIIDRYEEGITMGRSYEEFKARATNLDSSYRNITPHLFKKDEKPHFNEKDFQILYNKLLHVENIKGATFKLNGHFYITAKHTSRDHIYFLVYRFSGDNSFKSRLKNTGFHGVKINMGGEEFTWVESGEKIKELKPLKRSGMNWFTPQHLTVELETKVDHVSLLINNKEQITLKYHLLILLAAIGIVKVAVSVLSAKNTIKKFQSPLNSLVNQTELLASNEVNEKLSKKNYDFEEFQQLADTFNKVLLSRELSELKLFKSFEQMEDIVNKRTKELTDTNSRLNIAIKKAQEANLSKSQFLANISHEIRTPLNCIIGFCDIILSENKPPEENREVLHILHESETLLHLINDILDHSKIDAGKMGLNEGDVRLHSMIDSLMSSGHVQAGDKELTLSHNISSDIPELFLSDELRLYQVISNLFFNAVKFTIKGSVNITVDRLPASTEDSFLLQITITDTGIGIPEDKIETIFETFQQVDGSLTREYRGSGLGLAISKKIVELMKGTIMVKSTVDVGSSFRVVVPVKIKKEYLPQKQTCETGNKGDSHKRQGKILLVEDYPVNQIVAKKHLEMAGHTVYTAANGVQATEICDEESFDIILMDLQMPVMDGYEATEIIRKQSNKNKEIPILAMTANAMESGRNSCFESGMNDIITKPIRKEVFLQTISKWLKDN